MDKIRVLRVIEYEGDRAVLEAHLNQVLQGTKVIRTAQGIYSIKAASLGTFPEILTKDTHEQTTR
jgi:hypothetical protein